MYDSFLDSIPDPFKLLNIKKARSSSGKCWLFHMDEKGKFIGCCFPSGYRLYKTHNAFSKGNYFIEFRNFRKTRRNVVSAKVKTGNKIGQIHSKMSLTNGIKYCNIEKSYMMSHHTWKSTTSYNDFKSYHKTNKVLDNFF